LLLDRFADIETEAAEVLHKTGMIDSTTMRRFDQECLTPIMTLTPEAIRKIRT
jgi:putative transcriptional regulator